MKPPSNVKQTGRKSISNVPLNGKISKKKPSRLSLPDTSKIKQGLLEELKNKSPESKEKPVKHSPLSNANKKSSSSPEVKLGLEIEALLENASQPKRSNDSKIQEKPGKLSLSNKNTPKKLRFSISTTEVKNSPQVEKSTSKKRSSFVVSNINVGSASPKKINSSSPVVSKTVAKDGTEKSQFGGKKTDPNRIKHESPPTKRNEETKQVQKASVSPANQNINSPGKKKRNRKRRSSSNVSTTSDGKRSPIISVPEGEKQASRKVSITPRKVKSEETVLSNTTPEQKLKAVFRKTPFPPKKEKVSVLKGEDANFPKIEPSKLGSTGASKPEAGMSGSSEKIKSKKRRSRKKKKNEKSVDLSGYLDKDKVLDAVRALLKNDASVVASDKTLFSGSPRKVSVQINSIKIADTPQVFIRVPLPHPIVPDVADVCLFVCDLKGKRREPDLAVEHYTELLKKFKIDCINKVIAFRQLNTDYAEFELKRKLACSHDKFLVDAKICNRILPAIGKHFFEKNKIPTPVSLSENKIKESIKKGLSKCLIQVTGKGNSFFTEVGHTGMKENELTENLLKLAYGLDKLFPGGWKNIRSLQIKTEKTKLLPLYLSLLSPNKVQKPVVENIKKPPVPVRDELSTIPNADVVVYPSGKVRVRKRKADSDDEDETPSAQEKKEDEGSASDEESASEEGEDEVDDEDNESEEEEEDKDELPKKRLKDEENTSEDEDEEDEDESDGEDGSSSEEDEDEKEQLRAKKSSSLSAKKDKGKKAKTAIDHDESSSEEEIKMAEEDYLETLHRQSSPVKKVNKNKTNLPSKPGVIKGKIAKGKGPIAGKKKKWIP